MGQPTGNPPGRPRKPPEPPKPKGKRGYPAHVPTEQSRGMVTFLLATGNYTQMGIAKAIGVSDKTLRHYYRPELDQGVSNMDAAVMSAFYKNCTGWREPTVNGVPGAWHDSNVTAQIWYTKVRLRWKPPEAEIKHSGSIGNYDLEKLSLEQLEALESILTQAAIVDGTDGQGQTVVDLAPGDYREEKGAERGGD